MYAELEGLQHLARVYSLRVVPNGVEALFARGLSFTKFWQSRERIVALSDRSKFCMKCVYKVTLRILLVSRSFNTLSTSYKGAVLVALLGLVAHVKDWLLGLWHEITVFTPLY